MFLLLRYSQGGKSRQRQLNQKKFLLLESFETMHPGASGMALRPGICGRALHHGIAGRELRHGISARPELYPGVSGRT